VPKLPGINHLDAVRALEMTIPQHNPVNAYTMGTIVQDAGLTVDGFRRSL
jgi:hypothetical protein